MKKASISLLSILLYYSSLSQTVSIIDKEGNAVSYATIEVPKRSIAFFAGIDGKTNLQTSGIAENDTLTVSAIGFNSRKIAVKRISDTIIVERQIKELQEVFVYNGEWKEENWGSKKNRGLFGFGCTWSLNGPGSQIGRIIKPVDEKKKPAFIYKISFYTEHAKDTRSPVRLRIYAIDEKEVPGKDILQENLIEEVDKNRGWLTFDLTGNEIRIPEQGLIVAAEYFDTDEKNWYTGESTYIDSTGKKKKMSYKHYGGSFATNDETSQGATLMRFNGYWLIPSKSGRHPECENLVIRVWVKYPEAKN